MALAEPEPRLIRSARDAEEVACSWLRHWGYADATLTGHGTDEGIDVQGADVVAQVKADVKPIGRPIVQSLGGVAAVEGKTGVFFALGGYTAEALAWATRAGIAAFAFDLTGAPDPVNESARNIAHGSAHTSGGSQASASYRFTKQVQAEPLVGPWAHPLPKQDLFSAPLNIGERADPRSLGVTIADRCIEAGKTIAGRAEGLWTRQNRYLWSLEMNEHDGAAEGSLEVFVLALPNWRHGQLPEPLPTHFESYTFDIMHYFSDQLTWDGLDGGIADAMTRRDEIFAESLAQSISLTVTYSGMPWEKAVVQAVADLNSIMQVLGSDLASHIIEERDFAEEQRASDASRREEARLTALIEDYFPSEDDEYVVRITGRFMLAKWPPIERIVAEEFGLSAREARRRTRKRNAVLGVLKYRAAMSAESRLQDAGAFVDTSPAGTD